MVVALSILAAVYAVALLYLHPRRIGWRPFYGLLLGWGVLCSEVIRRTTDSRVPSWEGTLISMLLISLVYARYCVRARRRDGPTR